MHAENKEENRDKERLVKVIQSLLFIVLLLFTASIILAYFAFSGQQVAPKAIPGL